MAELLLMLSFWSSIRLGFKIEKYISVWCYRWIMIVTVCGLPISICLLSLFCIGLNVLSLVTLVTVILSLFGRYLVHTMGGIIAIIKKYNFIPGQSTYKCGHTLFAVSFGDAFSYVVRAKLSWQ